MSTTKIIKIDPYNPKTALLKEAADAITRGELVIIPTETVYGIAANITNEKTMERLCSIKQRPNSKPFTILINDTEKIDYLAANISIAAYKLVDMYMPGPITLIFHGKEGGTVGLRVPDNFIARTIISLAKGKIACPSANLSGGALPVDFATAIKDLQGLVDLAIDAGGTDEKQESTIVDVTSEPFKVIREGVIPAKRIQDAVARKRVLFVCTGNSCRSIMAEALLQKKLDQMGRKDVEVISAGVASLDGFDPTHITRAILTREGIDPERFHSKRVTRNMVNSSDLILVMEKAHEQIILAMEKRVKNRLFLVKEFAQVDDNDIDVADPIGLSEVVYEQTFCTIKEAVEKISTLI